MTENTLVSVYESNDLALDKRDSIHVLIPAVSVLWDSFFYHSFNLGTKSAVEGGYAVFRIFDKRTNHTLFSLGELGHYSLDGYLRVVWENISDLPIYGRFQNSSELKATIEDFFEEIREEYLLKNSK